MKLQTVLVALLIAAMLGGYNFVIEMRQFQATALAELRTITATLEKLETRLLLVEKR